MSNPHYLPEVCIKVTIINFTVTKSGLEDQLLRSVYYCVLSAFSHWQPMYCLVPLNYMATSCYDLPISFAVHFSMKNIYQSCDLGHGLYWYLHDVGHMALSAGVPPPGCSKTSVRQYLIINTKKTSLIGCRVTMDIWQIIWNVNIRIEVSSSDEKH